MQRIKTTALILGCLVLACAPASAGAGDLVYSPIVSKGEGFLEYRGHMDADNDLAIDGGEQHIFEFGYGITDRWKSAVFLDLQNPPGAGGVDAKAYVWENILQLTEKGAYPVDLGVYVEYKHAAISGEPDKLESKLLIEKSSGLFKHNLNINFEKELNNNAEPLEFGYAMRSTYEISEHLKVGAQMFGSFGEFSNFAPKSQQNHRIGPGVFGEFEIADEIKLAYQASYLFGLTAGSPDRRFVWLMELEFEF